MKRSRTLRAVASPIRVTRTGRDRHAERPRSTPVQSQRANPERRDLDPPQDTATYNCSCGLVFEAPVHTSVGCPHCGGQQAW
jgi:hypothetical protein